MNPKQVVRTIWYSHIPTLGLDVYQHGGGFRDFNRRWDSVVQGHRYFSEIKSVFCEV